MTALGKILVFLVLVLSLVFNALVVNAYVARTNWQKEASRSQADARKAADAATAMRTQLDEVLAANEAAKGVLREERDRYYNQVVTLQTQVNELTKLQNEQYGVANRQNAQAAVLQGNIDRLTRQVDDADRRLAEKEVQVNQLTLASEASKVAENEARQSAAAEKLRSDTLAQQLRDSTDQLQDLRRQGPGVARAAGPVAPALPPGFRGTVQAYDRESGLVSLTPGADAGVREGAEMTVFRLTGGGLFLGKVKILRADPKLAVGRFVPASSKRQPAPDDYPRAGDEVTPSDYR